MGERKEFIAGGLAGLISRTTTAPLDRLKVLQQTKTMHHTQRLGMLEGIKFIYKHGGMRSYYVGNCLNVLKATPESAIKFYAFNALGRKFSNEQQQSSHGAKVITGGLAGGFALASVYPVETLKTRLQVQDRASTAKLALSIWKREGLRGFYRGLTPSLMGMVPYTGIDLATYHVLRGLFIKEGENTHPLVALGCGMVGGATGAVSVFPLQLVRTRLQINGYRGVSEAFKMILKEEGLRGFYKGLSVSLVKVLPQSSVTYLVYEMAKTYLK